MKQTITIYDKTTICDSCQKSAEECAIRTNVMSLNEKIVQSAKDIMQDCDKEKLRISLTIECCMDDNMEIKENE